MKPKEPLSLTCPKCKGPRTIYFDHIGKKTYALCRNCEGQRVTYA